MFKNINKLVILIFSGILMIVVACGGSNIEEVSTQSKLSVIKERGRLICGVNPHLAGFSSIDSNGEWKGIDIDVCRAVAAAVFGDDTKVEYIPLNAKERFAALQSRQVDVLSRNSTWTISRDTSLGIIFAGVNYYDGQGFIVNKKTQAKKGVGGSNLDGATFCIVSGSTTELNLGDYFREKKLSYKSISFDTHSQSVVAFEEGRCDALTADHSELASIRVRLKDPKSSEVLAEVISKEPLGPAVAQGDAQWLNIVKWSLYALIEAEELRLTSQNVASFKNDPKASPGVKRFLGVEDKLGENLGLSNDWVYNIISLVGNYGEVFEQNLGIDSPIGIKRAGGPNDNWKNGGLMYSMPFR